MREPPTRITLLDNPTDTAEIKNLNRIMTLYNTAKNDLDNKLHISSTSQKLIMITFGAARTHLGAILRECQNDPAIQATIAVEFNIERQYLINVAITKSYPPITLVRLPEPASGPGSNITTTTPTPDPHAKRRAIIRAVSFGVGALSLSYGLGIISQAYKQGTIAAVKKAAAPLAISGAGLLIGGSTYFDLKRRQSGTLPNIVIPPITHGNT